MRGTVVLGDEEAIVGRHRTAEEKAELREAARALRRAGRPYREIAAALGISTSTCSVWLRDVVPDADSPRRRGGPSRVYWDAVLAQRECERQRVRAQAASRVGEVSGRDLLLALAVSYWCEGTKAKPWRRQERLVWLNSDARLVRLFLAGLRELGVPDERRVFRLSLHESADEPAARRWWAEVVGVPADRFARTSLKRHDPQPGRRGTGADYHGCLSVSVLQSRELYQQLDGLVAGLVRGATARHPPSGVAR